MIINGLKIINISSPTLYISALLSILCKELLMEELIKPCYDRSLMAKLIVDGEADQIIPDGKVVKHCLPLLDVSQELPISSSSTT